VSARIDDLEPVTRALCEAFLADCLASGLEVRVTHTLRTMDEQANLYAKGRFTGGAIVTWAKPGESPHNCGAAFDICFRGRTLEECYPLESDPRWEQVGHIGRVLGLRWGGDWKGKKQDRPHFERADWRSIQDGRAVA